MKVFITGASGLVGRALTQALIAEQHTVVALTRDATNVQTLLQHPNLEWVQGDPTGPGRWMFALKDCQAVVNLAGEPILGRRWNRVVQKSLVESRVETTRTLVKAIAAQETPPRVLVSASAVGYYGSHPSGTVDEHTPPGTDFLATLAHEWETAAQQATSCHVRVVVFRLGIVLSPESMVLRRMLPMFRLGVGGPFGSGQQPFPWVSLRDTVCAMVEALEPENPSNGAYNLVAPELITQREFVQALGRVLRRPAWLKVPAWALRVSLGPAAEVVLAGQSAIPARLQQQGFVFSDVTITETLERMLNP